MELERKKFESSSSYYDEIGITKIKIWTIFRFWQVTRNKKSFLQRTFESEYKSIATDKPNSITHEKTHSNRIRSFAKTLEPFIKFVNDDDFSCVLHYYRELLYAITIVAKGIQ